MRHEGSVEAIALSPDGRRAVSSHEPREVTLARIGRGKFPDPPVEGVARVWDAVTGAELFRLGGHRSTVYAVAFSPDGTTIATASYRQLRLWEAGSGKLRREVTSDEIDSQGLVFDPTGRTIATASEDAVRLWDTATGARLAELPGQAGIRFGAMVFSRDGSRVVTAFGRVVRLWDAATGQEIMTLPSAGEERVLALGFTSDGHRLLAALYDGSVLAWDARPDEKRNLRPIGPPRQASEGQND
jgi:WD40 repeat protein